MPDYNMNTPQQRDIILSPNEFVFVQSNTNGIIKTYAGPITITISTQDTLVKFDNKTKKFIPVNNIEEAKQLFILPPENWYAILKNPAPNKQYPEIGKASVSPELSYGRKINIKGPTTFALFPGQMAKVVRGHVLRSNQYLLARVYEAESANNEDGEILDSEGNKISAEKNYVNGQILVIKGTEVSFYIPPTGIEVIPYNENIYVREAVTLERLEYCILKDEDGNKRYVHGPKVVFPKPTESFVPSSKNNYIFRAIELSKISGIYVKVIAEYSEQPEDETNPPIVHPVGEELFITGNDQMIYYPRPEHAIINYDGKIVHHAIAIPEGEGRYVMNRLTGEIKTVMGPAMYLPDPRTEVVVKRKLTPRQCQLWYPGNCEVLNYNMNLSEKVVEKTAKKVFTDGFNYCDVFNKSNNYTTSSCLDSNYISLDELETKASISRGTSYTKPRTIMLDTKFDGAVSIDVWTGYAVNVVSKNGDRKVVCGPQTIVLDYDQTLEVMNLSTGKPKTTDKLESTVFLHYENNKISDVVNVTTKDYVNALIKVSYCVNFIPEQQNKWFNIENYVKYLCDFERSVIRSTVKEYTIEELYHNYHDIVKDTVTSDPSNTPFLNQNGMYVYDCEVLDISIDSEVEAMLEEHREEMVEMALKLSNAERHATLVKGIEEANQAEEKIKAQTQLENLKIERDLRLKKLEAQCELNRKKEAEDKAVATANHDIQKLNDLIQDAKLARKKKEQDQEIEYKTQLEEIEQIKRQTYADVIEQIIKAISPDLVAAITTNSNAEMLSKVSQAMAPLAIANGESISDTVNKLLRGTTLENIIDNFKKTNKSED